MKAADTRDIPKNQWMNFFQDIAKLYRGWAVTVEVLDGKLGDQVDMDGLPLQGISYDPVGSQKGDILVEAGDEPDAFEVHLVHKPLIVRAANTEPGAETDIEIETHDKITHVISIRARPELPGI